LYHPLIPPVNAHCDIPHPVRSNPKPSATLLDEKKIACGQAIICFRRRKEFSGFEPAMLFIHPEHAALVEAQSAPLIELGLTWELNPKVARRHLWLVGRLKEKESDK
jgi:hypothetical protein